MKKKNLLFLLVVLLFSSYIIEGASARVIRDPSFKIKSTEDSKKIEKLSSIVNSTFKQEKRVAPKTEILATEYEAIIAQENPKGNIIGGLLYQTELDSILLEEEFYHYEMGSIQYNLVKKNKKFPIPYIDFYVAVKEKYRSQGIGSKLFSKMSEVAYEENWGHFLFLSVRGNPGYCDYLNSEIIYEDETGNRYLILYNVPSNPKN